MHRLSILLGLSGSEQSKYAAEVAWLIAGRANGRVEASHVIDTRVAWDFLRNDKPGFIGSGVYVEAYEALVKSLNKIGDAVKLKFDAVAEGQKVPTTSIVEEGSPVRRLSDRAAQHDLVVIGHQSRDSKRKEAEYCNFVRYAVAEGLANACPRPLLVVQDKLYFWSSMTILASVEHLNFDYVKACLNMAEILDLKPRLVLLASGVREESPESILKDLRAAQPELVDLDVSIEMLRGLSIEPDTKLWQSAEVEFDWTPDPDTLLVLPTRASGGHRITIFDTNADGFVRCLALPSILMWPEEYTSFEVKPATVQEKALAGESS